MDKKNRVNRAFASTEDGIASLESMRREQDRLAQAALEQAALDQASAKPEMSLDGQTASPSGDQPFSLGEVGGSRGAYDPNAQQKGVFPRKFDVTQKFGNYNPEIEKYSGGVNYGVDFASPNATPLALPSGDWVIEKADVGSFNSGYGNSVMAVNSQTGEKVRLSHLSKVNVVPGMKLRGGSIIGYSGTTGNSTGYHTDFELYDKGGKPVDVLTSNYARELFAQQ